MRTALLVDVPIGTKFRIVEKEINVMSGTTQVTGDQILVKLNDYSGSLFCLCGDVSNKLYYYPNKLSEICVIS